MYMKRLLLLLMTKPVTTVAVMMLRERGNSAFLAILAAFAHLCYCRGARTICIDFILARRFLCRDGLPWEFRFYSWP